MKIETSKENKILDLINTGIEGLLFIDNAIKMKNEKNILFMLRNINDLVIQVGQSLKNEKGVLIYYIILYCKNIESSISQVFLQEDKIYRIFQLEIKPCFFEIQRLLNLEYTILQKKENWEKYRFDLLQNTKNSLTNKDTKRHKYKISIVLVAYNKLEYTKKAIESIYKYTDFSKGEVELITVNNGSTDDTWRYFNSLPNKKKINLKYNILGGVSFLYNVEGEYLVGFSNDVIATPRWLSNLLKCIESLPEAAMVVPTCNKDSISNKQGIDIPYINRFEDMDKMEEFAAQYNYSKPHLWEERSVLMPFIHISRTKIFELFLNDCTYTQNEFSDDDFSTLLRRAGWKLILAKDTFMHHFGSVTLKAAQVNNNSLEKMRKVYYDKWGVDAWESRAMWQGLEECLQRENKFLTENMNLLFFEPKFGGAFLQFKNYYRQKGCFFDNNMAVVIDQRYIDDAISLFDEVVQAYNAIEVIDSIDKAFDIISSGVFLSELGKNNVIGFLEKAYTKLKSGGVMIFPIRNYRNVKVIMQLLLEGGVSSYDKRSYEFSGCSIRKLIENLQQHPYLCNCRIHFIPEGMSLFTEEIAEIFEKQCGMLSKENRNELYMELNSLYAIICISKL